MSTPETTGLDSETASELAQRVPRFAHGSRVPGWDQATDLTKDPASIPDPATTDVPPELRDEIERHMGNYPDRRSAALPALAAAQRLHGWCSPEAIAQVACVMRLTPAYLEAVATFYDMLETSPVGRHSVYVCTNISCSLRGADELYASFLDAAEGDAEFSVRAFECLGACDIAPMASVDGVYVGPLSTDDIGPLLEDVRAGRPVLPAKQLAVRPVADPRANSREWPAHPPVGGDARAVPGAATPTIEPEQARYGAPMAPAGEQDEPAAHPGRGPGVAPVEHAPPLEHAPHRKEPGETESGREDVREADKTEDRAGRRLPERDDEPGQAPGSGGQAPGSGRGGRDETDPSP